MDDLDSLGFTQFGKKRTHFQPRGKKQQNNNSNSRPFNNPSFFGTQAQPKKERQAPTNNQEQTFSVVADDTERQLKKQIGPIPSKLPIPKFPTSQELTIQCHPKRVLALASDLLGNHFYTGSDDGSIRYWSFGKLNAADPLPSVDMRINNIFKVNSIDATDDGKLVMVASASPEITFYNEVGLKREETRRGDMYLYDRSRTYGHTHEVLAVQFKPHDPSEFLSISVDGSIRIWSIEDLKTQKTYIRLNQKNEPHNPGRDAKYNPEGTGVYGVATDNSIRFWATNQVNVFSDPQLRIPTPDKVVALAIAQDGIHIAGRLEQLGEVLLYDIRNPSKPVFTFEADSNLTSIVFSPDSKFIAVPEIVHPRSRQGGSIQFVSVDKSEEDGYEMGQCLHSNRVWFPTGIGVRTMIWNEHLNQIICGCEDGTARVLFDKNLSRNGAIKTLEKGVKVKKDLDSAVIAQLTPQLVDPETERVYDGYYYPFPDPSIRDRRSAALPKAPLYGEGHHGQLATHPFQAQLRELNQIEEADNQDIIEALKSRNHEAKMKYFTKVSQKRAGFNSDDNSDN